MAEINKIMMMQIRDRKSYCHFQVILIIGLLFGFFLPLSTKLGNIILIIFLCATFWLVYRNKLKFNPLSIKALRYSTIVLMVPCILSVLFHQELLTAANIFGRRISFLLIPLSFLFFSSQQLLSLKKYSLIGILCGSVLSSMILLINNLLNYYATRPLFLIDDELLNFYYTGFYFTKLLDFHPSYLGMYVLLAVSILLFGEFNFSKGLRLTTVIFFFPIILFLNARVILFFYFLIILGYLLKYYLKLYGKSKKAIFSFLGAVSIILAITFFLIKETYVYTSLTKETIWELSFKVNEKYNSKTLGDSRVARWDVALDLIKDHPIFGYGVGNEKDILKIAYQKEGMGISATKRYDAHNLFFSYAIETGIFGAIILLYYILTSLCIFVKYKDFLFSLFFFSILGICLIENYLNNNAAIIFLAYFGNLFLYHTFLIKANKENDISQNI